MAEPPPNHSQRPQEPRNAETRRGRKGIFGRPRLPVTGRYLVPSTRWAMVLLGLAAGLVALLLGILDASRGGGALVSGGPLSSAHAMLETDCAACHGGFETVQDQSCAVCHEKVGDEIGTFGFAAHSIYRSGDLGRPRTADGEPTCATCHPEHEGRPARVLDVPDTLCQTCHEQTDFDDDHPQFAFAADPEGDDDALTFAHGHHVRELMQDAGWDDLEQACVACHQPTESGRGFRPIDFDLHCDACHLTAGVGTPRLPVVTTDAAGTSPGVLDLEQIRQSGAPGTDWAFYTNPGEFRGAGSRVAKTPLHHADPWILFNLRRLRQQVYPDAGLADLLVSSVDFDAASAQQLYGEIVATLEDQVRGLRGVDDPGTQAQLAEIEERLLGVRAALDDPTTPLDENALLLALDQPVELPAEERAAWQEVVDGLTAACVECHQVERATFVRVRNDQRTLVRSEFDHGAHVIQRRCLDCHGELPILEALSTAEAGPDPALLARDRSAVHNLPRIETCRECHQSGLVASRCIDCHAYHPGAERHGNLLLHWQPASQ